MEKSCRKFCETKRSYATSQRLSAMKNGQSFLNNLFSWLTMLPLPRCFSQRSHWCGQVRSGEEENLFKTDPPRTQEDLLAKGVALLYAPREKKKSPCYSKTSFCQGQYQSTVEFKEVIILFKLQFPWNCTRAVWFMTEYNFQITKIKRNTWHESAMNSE